MTDDRFYSISEVARELELPISTVRYYRDAFAHRIPTVGAGRRRLYPPTAVSLLRFIMESYASGATKEQIEQEIAEPVADARFADPVVTTVSEPPAMVVHQAQTSTEYQQLVSSLLEGESERRELLWQMVREISRFGQAIEQQHFVLTELVERVTTRVDRQLAAGPQPTDPSAPQNCESGSEAGSSHGNSEELRRALAHEQDLVERLRRSKLELERRAAAAEAELDQLRSDQRGVLQRLFGKENEG